MGFHLFKSSEKLTIPDNKEELLKEAAVLYNICG